jgi:hypothetical protein
VIKATLESARGAQAKRTGEHLMAGPPSALLEDIADRHPADVGAEHTAILQAPSSTGSKSGSIGPPPMVQGVPGLSTQMLQPQAMPHGTIPPGSARPLTNPPPPNSHPNLSNQSGGYPAHQSGGYAAQSGGYAAQYPGPVPAGSVSGSIVSMTGPQQQMPAHFMVPQAPYSDGRMDPPGTAVTARTKVGGRPAMSWAIALAAFGLFVGVGAVAVMHGNDGFTETSASFVDPSRAAGAKAMAPGVAAGQLAAPPTPVPVAADPPAVVGVPPVAVPAVPAVAAVAPTAEVAAAPVVTTPPAPVAPVAPVPAGGAAAVAVAVPVVAATAAPVAPTATVAVAPKPTAHHNTFVPQRPPPKPAEEVAAKPARPVKPAAGSGKPGGDSAVDEEQRKALKALQESQLETPF